MRKKDKTKFPVARIKKIMQMDEEVGKMAQATPVLISKSLELFMQSIVDDVCKHARVCNSRKVTTTHLKRCIESTACYDFLTDTVETVADDGDGGGADVCIARVAELNANGGGDRVAGAGDLGGGAEDRVAGADDLGGGGGGAPLSMILDAPPQLSAESGDTDDNTDDSSYTPRATTRSRGRSRGRGRGRGRASHKQASASEMVS